jgi:Flp pilus assembly protein TadG
MKKTCRVSGQALVEFALILPFILLIIIMFIDLGRIIYFHSALNNAVREGARYAIVNQFTSSIQRQLNIQQQVVKYAVTLPLDPNNVSIYCDQSQVDLINPCDDYVTVSAHMEIEPMAVFLARMIGAGNTFNIDAESTMQMTPYGRYVP